MPLAKQRLRIDLKVANEPLELIKHDLTYTPKGFAWSGWTLDGEASITTPSTLRHVYHASDFRAHETLDTATVIQSHSWKTYGDWIPCFLRRIVLTDALIGPILFPAVMRGKPYLEADLERLGIDYRFCDRPVRIRKCQVLRQPSRHATRPTGHRWTPDQLTAFRAAMKINPPKPKPGSLTYLSRVGVKSNLTVALDRDTRSDLAETVVTELGGRVVRTEGMAFQDFARLAEEVETLLCDHGAANCNLVQWAPKQVIELVPEDWWSWSFVPLARAAGAERYTVLRPRMRSAEAFAGLLRSVLRDATGRVAP